MKFLSFRLVLFAFASYFLILGLAGWQIYVSMTSELQQYSEQTNQQLTRIFANENWYRLRPLIRLTANSEEAKNNPNLNEISSIVRRFAAGTDLVAVKIFNAQGLMLYATDASQIGSDQSKSPEFLSAVRGKLISEFTHRDTIIGFNGKVHNRDLVSTYVPIKFDSSVEAVVEVYTDRTESLSVSSSTALKLVVCLAIVLATVMLLWLYIARRIHKSNLNAFAISQNECQLLNQKMQAVQVDKAARQMFLQCMCDLLSNPLEETLIQVADGQGGSENRSGSYITEINVASSTVSTLLLNLHILKRRLDELRKLIQVDAGTLRPNETEFDLAVILQQAVEQSSMQAAAKGSKVSVYMRPDQQICHGDEGMVKMVVFYLLMLSLSRVSTPGSIQLRALPESSGIMIEVIDSGDALSKDKLNILLALSDGMSPITRAASVGCDTESKIGLLLVSGLTNVMSGRIDVHSEAGLGTSVRLWLPLQPKNCQETTECQ